MVEKTRYSFIATFVAVATYLFFVYLLVDFIQGKDENKKDYGYNVDDAVVVELSAPPKKRPKPSKAKPDILPKPKPLPPQPEAKPEVKPEVKESKEAPEQKEKESRDIVEKSAKDLFSTVRTEKYDKIAKERQKQDAARASRLAKQKAEQARKKKKRQKALAAARAASQELSSITASHKKKGEENNFWSPIGNRITGLWNRTISTQDGLFAKVRITINAQGKLSYKIKQLSNNTLFDQKLRNFLQNLEYETFPKYKGGDSTSIVLTFKDES